MATIDGIVTIGDTEIPGQADVLLLNAAGTEVVASTTSDAATGAYAFEGLPGGTTYRVLVLGGGVYRSRAFGPVVTEAGGAGDPHWANVVSLLHFDGADGSTDFIDETGAAWVATGGAHLNASSSAFGPSSGAFWNSLGSRIYADGGGIMDPEHPLYMASGEDFTLEGFIQSISTSSWGAILVIGQGNKGLFLSSGRQLVWYETGAKINGETVWIDGKFHHVAAVRENGVLRLFLDGVLQGSAPVTIPVDRMTIGANTNGGDIFGGYIDELRITKGVARYTEDFTPPTEPFPNF